RVRIRTVGDRARRGRRNRPESCGPCGTCDARASTPEDHMRKLLLVTIPIGLSLLAVRAYAKDAPTDANIAAVLQTANQNEIGVAQTATAKTQNAEVKSFAEDMIKTHTDALKQTGDAAAKANITPSNNDLSSKLKSDGEATMQKLSSLTGPDFD